VVSQHFKHFHKAWKIVLIKQTQNQHDPQEAVNKWVG
jgi:hypothetical protein